MIGAIVGDVVGSPYEFHNISIKNFELFSNASRFTDDTVLTIALADSIMNKKDWLNTIHDYALRYRKSGFGGMFLKWVKRKDRSPYNSFGNGSAMRVSSIPWLFDSLREVSIESKISSEVTHNHPEGIKGAQAIAVCIYMAKLGFDKHFIKKEMLGAFYTNIPTPEETIKQYKDLKRNNKSMLYSCQCSVPQAIGCFLAGESFEDVIRTAVSIGGDSDTLAAMAGSIAEPFYGIPKHIEEQALDHLDKDLLKIVEQFKREVKYEQ